MEFKPSKKNDYDDYERDFEAIDDLVEPLNFLYRKCVEERKEKYISNGRTLSGRHNQLLLECKSRFSDEKIQRIEPVSPTGYLETYTKNDITSMVFNLRDIANALGIIIDENDKKERNIKEKPEHHKFSIDNIDNKGVMIIGDNNKFSLTLFETINDAIENSELENKEEMKDAIKDIQENGKISTKWDYVKRHAPWLLQFVELGLQLKQML